MFLTETLDKISNLFHEIKYIEECNDPWISHSVALFFILLNEDAYHQRYSKSDKAKAVNSKDWDVPYWFVDAGASMMNCMLLIEEKGLSSGFMGLHNTDRKEVNKLLNIPENYLVIGLITAGVQNESIITKSKEIKRKKLIHNEKFSK